MSVWSSASMARLYADPAGTGNRADAAEGPPTGCRTALWESHNRVGAFVMEHYDRSS
jgi:hypothetical protein